MKPKVCGGCGHLKVCHRYGPCEYVERTGWSPVHNGFAKEKPCTCTKWQERAKKRAV